MIREKLLIQQQSCFQWSAGNENNNTVHSCRCGAIDNGNARAGSSVIPNVQKEERNVSTHILYDT
jgi:hypothetical protein